MKTRVVFAIPLLISILAQGSYAAPIDWKKCAALALGFDSLLSPLHWVVYVKPESKSVMTQIARELEARGAHIRFIDEINGKISVIYARPEGSARLKEVEGILAATARYKMRIPAELLPPEQRTLEVFERWQLRLKEAGVHYVRTSGDWDFAAFQKTGEIVFLSDPAAIPVVTEKLPKTGELVAFPSPAGGVERVSMMTLDEVRPHELSQRWPEVMRALDKARRKKASSFSVQLRTQDKATFDLLVDRLTEVVDFKTVIRVPSKKTYDLEVEGLPRKIRALLTALQNDARYSAAEVELPRPQLRLLR